MINMTNIKTVSLIKNRLTDKVKPLDKLKIYDK